MRGRSVSSPALIAVLLIAHAAREGRAQDGLAQAPTAPTTPTGWTDWRGGARRDAICDHVPTSLPAAPQFLWRRTLTGQSLGGLAATETRVIVSDKSRDGRLDIWRCLDAGTGAPIWKVEYAAPGEMDFTGAPRATPVIRDRAVTLLGAFGHLRHVDLHTGETRWKLDLVSRFGGKLPTWGFCGTPLAVDDKLIVSTASPRAALVALARSTGQVVWTAPGQPIGYGSFIVGRFGGKRQIVGHDAKTAGGWDVATGERLWAITPREADFNVPTPVQIGEQLLLATESNGVRLHAFRPDGTILPRPVATNDYLLPDTASPVYIDGRLWGACSSGLYCLDPSTAMKTVWSREEPPFADHASLIAGRGHVLAMLKTGHLVLLRSRPAEGEKPVASVRLFEPKDGLDPEVWSHPALVGDRLYLRTADEIVCVRLAETKPTKPTVRL